MNLCIVYICRPMIFQWFNSSLCPKYQHSKAALDCLLKCAATTASALTSQLTLTSQRTLPRTSPPRGAQRAGVSALRTSSGTDTMHPSEAEQTLKTNVLPEHHSRATTKATARATATQDMASPTLPASGKISHPFLSCLVCPPTPVPSGLR